MVEVPPTRHRPRGPLSSLQDGGGRSGLRREREGRLPGLSGPGRDLGGGEGVRGPGPRGVQKTDQTPTSVPCRRRPSRGDRGVECRSRAPVAEREATGAQSRLFHGRHRTSARCDGGTPARRRDTEDARDRTRNGSAGPERKGKRTGAGPDVEKGRGSLEGLDRGGGEGGSRAPGVDH